MSFKVSYWRNTYQTYGAVSQILHWLTAFLVFAMLALGWGREIAPGTWRSVMMDFHKSIGFCVLFLLVCRLSWRVWNVTPALPPATPRFFQQAALLAHGALYALLLAMPLSGWLVLSAAGRPAHIFGLALPSLIEKNRSLLPWLKEGHETGAYALAILVLLHMLAALYHHFVYKDNVLIRMLPLVRKE